MAAVAFSKKELARSIAKDRAATLKKLRAAVKGARGRKRAALAGAAAQCRAGRDKAVVASQLAREAIARARDARLSARGSCALPAGVAALQDAISVAASELRAEEEHARYLREADRAVKSRTSKPGPAKARERASESDDEVRANLPPELVGLFDRVRRSIKGSARKSRTEAFLEYVEEHPGEAFDGIDDATDRMIAEHESQLRRGARNPKKPKKPTKAEAAAEAAKAAKWQALFADPRFIALEKAKDEALRDWNRADAWALSADKRPPSIAANDRAKRDAADLRAKAALQALFAYEESFFAKNPAPAPERANPSAPLVLLGELVSIVYKPGAGRRRVTLRFPRTALLAYRGDRLVIVYAERHGGGKGTMAGGREYRRTHWGLAGKGRTVEGLVLQGAAPELGEALEITYATRKGRDRKLVNYWHVFGDFGDAKPWRFEPPTLVAARCDGRPLARLDGGTYRVTAHGIVG